MKTYDLFIVGGGINGCGIARDAAGRGLRVGLCEQHDLAAHTSSASTKLIHGGLRYLEYREFGLVRKSLHERELLLHAAPHIIRPLAFVLPHHRGLRPAWLLRLGLLLYDLLGGFASSLPRSARVALDRPPLNEQLRSDYRLGFLYHDCWVDDARLTVLNALDATERGADIRTRQRCVGLQRGSDRWTIELERSDRTRESVRSRVLINAAGPWVGELAGRINPRSVNAPLRLIKGSHIVLPRLYNGHHAYLFQNKDGRVAFAIPYEGRFTLVGTTEVALDRPSDPVAISAEEETYLCALAGAYFARPIQAGDIVWRYSGIRSLFDDQARSASQITRNYVLDLDLDGAPALSVYGGKITTYRRLAEDVLTRIKPLLNTLAPAWTGRAHLPGGDFPPSDFEGRMAACRQRYRFLEPATVERLWRAYGTRIDRVLGPARRREDLGRHFGGGLYQSEVDYCRKSEFARTAEDLLWRRSKLGLHLNTDQHRVVRRYFLDHGSEAPS